MRRLPGFGLFLTLVLGVLLEPLGHAAAYLVRYGPVQAWALESQGGHASFPRVLSLSSLSLAVLLSLGLATAVTVRLILGGRRIDRTGLMRTFLVLALTQSAFFGVKETLEALTLQSSPDFLLIAVLAVLVQLPLAGAAALLISWLRGYLELAPEAIHSILAIRLGLRNSGRLLRPLPQLALRPSLRAQRWYLRRAPPLSA